MQETKHHRILVLSSFFLLLPLLVFYQKEEKTTAEYFLAGLLCINITISVLFWFEPTRNSAVHTIDAFFARVSLVSFIVYILFHLWQLQQKIFLFVFMGLLTLSMVIFWLSNHHSSKKWCSPYHIFHHFLFHFVIAVGSSFAFFTFCNDNNVLQQ